MVHGTDITNSTLWPGYGLSKTKMAKFGLEQKAPQALQVSRCITSITKKRFLIIFPAFVVLVFRLSQQMKRGQYGETTSKGSGSFVLARQNLSFRRRRDLRYSRSTPREHCCM